MLLGFQICEPGRGGQRLSRGDREDQGYCSPARLMEASPEPQDIGPGDVGSASSAQALRGPAGTTQAAAADVGTRSAPRPGSGVTVPRLGTTILGKPLSSAGWGDPQLTWPDLPDRPAHSPGLLAPEGADPGARGAGPAAGQWEPGAKSPNPAHPLT